MSKHDFDRAGRFLSGVARSAETCVRPAVMPMSDKRVLSSAVPARAARHLRAFRRDVERALPGRVSGVILFGSRARGDARDTSDYDVAVLVKDMPEERRHIDKILSKEAYSHILDGIHIRPIAVEEDFMNKSSTNILANEIQNEGLFVL